MGPEAGLFAGGVEAGTVQQLIETFQPSPEMPPTPGMPSQIHPLGEQPVPIVQPVHDETPAPAGDGIGRPVPTSPSQSVERARDPSRTRESASHSADIRRCSRVGPSPPA